MPEDPDGRAERASWLTLSLTPGIGPLTTARLLQAFGPPEDILRASHARLSARIGPALATAVLADDPQRARAVQASLRWAEAPGRALITLDDPRYPPRLLQTPDPPPVLWAQGRLERLHSPALAIVGSRSATRGGQETATDWARALGEQGLTIVSGLALGIDAAAHRGALRTPGGTIAVLGTGIERIYPRQQRALAQHIATEGLLLSELPPEAEPRRAAFPRRNRLIAGLSLGVLVVEAAIRSGSLITARLATDLGREVFAMPGSIHSPTAKGCHWLIKQGAQLVECADDVWAAIDRQVPGLRPAPAPADATRPEAPGSPDDDLLASLGWDPADLDTLIRRRHDAGSAPGEDGALFERLLALELAGRVERTPEGTFKRIS